MFCVLRNRRWFEHISELITISIVLTTIVAFAFATVLAIIGVYSLVMLSLMMSILAFFGFFHCRKYAISVSLRSILIEIRDYRPNRIIFVFILIGFVLYSFFPVNYIWGGRDHGLYVINGVNISYTGSINFDSDELKTELYLSPHFEKRLGYPGLYSAYGRDLSNDPSQIIAQFLPLYMAATSIAYDIFGLPAVFRLNGIIALYSCLVIYFLCKSVFTKHVATLAFVFMLLNPAQLWNGRIPGTEILSQLLFFLAMLFFHKAWISGNKHKDSIIMPTVSGLLILLSMFSRIDSYIWGVGIFILWSYTAFFKHDKLSLARTIGLVYTVGLCLSLWFGFTFSQPYFYDLWVGGSLSGIIYINIFFFALVVFSEVMLLITRKPLSNPDYLTKLLDYRTGASLICILFMILFLTAYFVRPLVNYSFDGNAMVEFTWYTSFIAIPLSIYGLYLALRGNRIKLESQYLLLLIGLISMIGYIYRPSITPDHFWASRRWVTVNIPFVLLYCSLGICGLFKHIMESTDKKMSSYLYSIREITGTLCTIIIFTYTASQSSIFLFQPMFEGVVDSMAYLAEQFEPDAVLLTTNGNIAGPLRFVFRKNAYMVTSKPGHDPNFNSQIYFITERTDTQSNFDVNFQLVSNHNVSGQFPERSMGRYPSELIDWGWGFSVYRVEASNGYITFNLAEKSSGFGSQNSHVIEIGESIETRTFVSDGSEGFLLFGPYMSLESGIYKVELHIRLLESRQYELGRVEVYSQYSGEPQVFAQKRLSPDLFNDEHEALIILPFSLSMNQDGVEYRVFVTEGTILQVETITIMTIDME